MEVMASGDTIDIFFSLLRSGLYRRPVPESELPASIDWPAVMALAKKHVVRGVIVDSTQWLPERLRPSASMRASMGKYAMGLIQTNLVLDRTAARLAACLRGHGIEGVMLKGQGVALYYAAALMRHCGDIDYYVGKKHYREAMDVCRRELSDDKNADEETEQHFGFMMGGIPIELHRLASRVYSPVKGKRFQRWVEYELEQSPRRRRLNVGDDYVMLPSYDFDAIFIFYHAWRHFITGGIGMRQLCDWTMIFHTHAGDIDTERLAENLDRFGMTKGWKLFGCIAVNHLGLPADKMPLYDPAYAKKSEKVLEEIIEGGNFGRYTKEYARTRGRVTGLGYGLNKLRAYTKYYMALLPLTPVEATCLYANRLLYGTLGCIRRARDAKK